MEKNRLMFIIIIVLLVVLLITIAGVSFYAIRMFNPAEEENRRVNAEEVPRLAAEQITTLNLSGALSTNLLTSDDGTDHVIKISMGIGLNNTDEEEFTRIQALLTENETVSKDLILGIIRNKTYEELKKPDGQAALKEEIRTALQDYYQSNLIVQVSVSEIILQ